MKYIKSTVNPNDNKLLFNMTLCQHVLKSWNTYTQNRCLIVGVLSMLGGVSVSVSLEITGIIHICYWTKVIDVYYNCNQKEK